MSRILFFDIETSPAMAYIWRCGKQYVDYNQIVEGEESRIICICWKWLDTNERGHVHWDLRDHSDASLLRKFTPIANSADIVMGHNIDNFDIKHVRTRIAINDIKEARWAENLTADTLKQYRRSFAFESNRLDSVARMLGEGQKNPMSFDDWVKVRNGDRESLDKMIKYCHKDVDLNIRVHKRLAPYIKTVEKERKLAKLSLTDYKVDHCTNCGSDNYTKYGVHQYRDEVYQKYMCRNCHTVFPRKKDLNNDN